jgi:class 3 adenylate cyclase
MSSSTGGPVRPQQPENRIPWRFDRAQEAQFVGTRFREGLRSLRLAIIASAVLTSLFNFLVVPYFVAEDGAFERLVGAFASVGLLCGSLALSYTKSFLSYGRWLVVVVLIALGLLIVSRLAATPMPWRPYVYGGTMLYLSVCYGLLSLPVSHATLAGWSVTALFWYLHKDGDTYTATVFPMIFIYLVLANCFGMTMAFVLERKDRRDFARTHELFEERERAESLLLNILPMPIAERLKRDRTTIADSYPEVTVLFADIVGFTHLAAQHSPQEVVSILNELFSEFDAICDEFRVEKIKTIGDAYMAVAGLPNACRDHALRAAEVALRMAAAVHDLATRRNLPIKLRIGLNTGPVVAGVIGRRKMLYDLWGDTVNVASRMESTSEAGCIQVSRATRDALDDTFAFSEARVLDVKGRGAMETYILRERRQTARSGRPRWADTAA